MNKRKHKYNPLYKNLLRLKVNPLNNNKFLKLKLKIIKYKTVWCSDTKQKKQIPIKRWELTKNSKKKKWREFLEAQIRSKKFFNRFKPHTNYAYKINKFASQGNSFKKKFKSNLLAKTTFSYLYGGLPKKFLKAQMIDIYRSKKMKNSIRICMESFESRLDSILYRAHFCKSVKNARQLISHKHVKVNGVVEKNKDYIVKQGDLITLHSKSMKLIKKNLKEKFKKNPDFIIWPLPPKYFNVNYKTLEIVMGNIENFNFSSSFPFKLDTHAIVRDNFRN
jgi:small subunit ribosomal protein S4